MAQPAPIGDFHTLLACRGSGFVLGVLEPVVALDYQGEEQGRTVCGSLSELDGFPGAVVCGRSVTGVSVEGARPGQRDCLFVEVISGAGDFEPLFGVAESLTAVSLVHVFEGEVNQEVSVVAARRKLLVLGEEILDQVLSPLWIHVGDPVGAVAQQAESLPPVGPVGVVTKRTLGQRLGGTSCAAEGEGEDGATNHFRFGEQERLVGMSGVEVEGPLVPARGVGVPAKVPGALGGELGHLQLGRLVAGALEVVGDLGDGRGVVKGLQGVRDPAVVGGGESRQLGQQRLGDQGVPWPDSTVITHEQGGRLQLLDRGEAGLLVVEGDHPERGYRDRSGEHGERGDGFLGGGRDGSHPCGEKLGKTARQSLAVRARGDQLLGEERVALPAGEHRGGKAVEVEALGMGECSDQASHLIRIEGLQAQLVDTRGARQGVEPAGDLLRHPGLVGAVGDQYVQARAVAGSGEVGEQVEGVGICPVHVLDHQCDRPFVRDPREQRRCRDEQLVTVDLRRRPDLLGQRPRHHAGDVRAQ